MKKIMMFVLALIMLPVPVMAADVVLETTVPDAYVANVIEMLSLFSGKAITVRVGSPGLRAVKAFTFVGITDGEGQKDFAERFIKEFMLNGLRIVEKYKADNAITEAVNAIDIQEAVVSDDSVQ